MKRVITLATLLIIVTLTSCNKSDDDFSTSEQIKQTESTKTGVAINKDEVEVPPVL